MNHKFETISSGTVTSPEGFLAGAVRSGIKDREKLDLAVLYSEEPCVAAGVFTTNIIKAAPVIISQKYLQNRRAQAIVVNSGCANACTGDPGLSDAVEMASLVSKRLGILQEDVMVASTGVIGVPLPMMKVRTGISRNVFSRQEGTALARARMNTDTFIKEIAVSIKAEPRGFAIGGVAKGAGMIHPDMATMLCFLTTDASVDDGFLQAALQRAVDLSFNMVTIDGDTSPSDMVIVLANGLAGNEVISDNNGEAFQEALNSVCLYLARSIARDGEGATKLIEVVVEGASNQSEARLAARTVASSSLVKTAMYGNDPNWGRIVAALGRSGAEVAEKKLELYLNDVCVMKQGCPVAFNKEELSLSLADKTRDVCARLCLNLGDSRAIAWGCDLSEEYVTINSAYTT